MEQVPCSTGLRLGGAYRDRTDDPLLAKQVLSQLSYTPGKAHITTGRQRGDSMVGLDGLEPSTPALSRRCSNQLSYRPGDTRPDESDRLPPALDLPSQRSSDSR